MCDFNRRDWRSPTLHTLQPVAVMFFAFIQVNLLWSDYRSDDPGIACLKRFWVFQFCNRIACRYRLVAARDEDPSLCALKLDPIWQLSADNHSHPIGIKSFSTKLAVHIPETF